jgi:hypothetical protein
VENSRIRHAIHLTHLAVDFVFIARIWHLYFGFYLTNLACHLRELLYRIEVSIGFGALAQPLYIMEKGGVFGTQTG